MTYLTRDRARELARAEVGPCLSLYLDFGDTRPADDGERQRRLARALDKLHPPAAGPSPDALAALTDPIRGVLEWDRFWRHQSLGLAVFCSVTVCRIFRLPTRVSPAQRVGPRFYLQPVLPLLADGARSRLLILGESYTRLHDCTAEACRLLDWYDLPLGLDDALGFDGRRRSLRFRDGKRWQHAATPVAVSAHRPPRPWVYRVARGVQRLPFGPEVPLVVGGHRALVWEFVGAQGPGVVRALDTSGLGDEPSCAALRRLAQADIKARAESGERASSAWRPPDLSSAGLAGT